MCIYIHTVYTDIYSTYCDHPSNMCFSAASSHKAMGFPIGPTSGAPRDSLDHHPDQHHHDQHQQYNNKNKNNNKKKKRTNWLVVSLLAHPQNPRK